MGEGKEGGVPRTRDLGFSMHRKMRRVLIGHRVFFMRKGEGFSWEGGFQKEGGFERKTNKESWWEIRLFSEHFNFFKRTGRFGGEEGILRQGW